MLLDSLMELSDAQSLVTAAASTIVSTNVWDVGKADPNQGDGNPIWVNCLIAGSVTCASDTGTVTPIVKHSTDDSTFSTLFAGDAKTFSTNAYASHELLAGDVLLCQALPIQHGRYIRVDYAVATSAVLAGTVDAWIGLSGIRDYNR
jgi:hypothetical protein